MSESTTKAIPLTALGVSAKVDHEADTPLAYIPRLPLGTTYRDLIERAVGWSRR